MRTVGLSNQPVNAHRAQKCHSDNSSRNAATLRRAARIGCTHEYAPIEHRYQLQRRATAPHPRDQLRRPHEELYTRPGLHTNTHHIAINAEKIAIVAATTTTTTHESATDIVPLRSSIAASFSDKPPHHVEVTLLAREKKCCPAVLLPCRPRSTMRTTAALTTAGAQL
jgi:hypothetical protein